MSEANTMSSLLPIPAAAVEAGVSEETMRNWCRKYKIGHKVAGRFRVNIPKLRAMLNPAPDGAEGEQQAA
jgi:hypothetical protein